MTITAGLGTAIGPAHEPISEDVLICGSDWERVVHWSDATRLGTPAFWVEQTRGMPTVATYQMGNALHEEVALCLLGGHGITETMALCAFDRLLAEDLLLGAGGGFDALHEALSRPFVLPGRERPVRYRFPTLKAQRLHDALRILDSATPPAASKPRELRDWLTTLPGVGLKTASWAVRNLTRSDDVAVIDIHIRRAGVAAGMFDPAWKLPRDYRRFEEAFVLWARIGGVPTADLDACIWTSLADLGRGARLLFGVNTLGELD
jgi:thermostable 8-oxoguanine DNA glycosylase